ncbi:RNA methyltransferase [Lacihabitans soyangensis]|nr:RNA methyltransferase [Lacihabitans soyangensis]
MSKLSMDELNRLSVGDFKKSEKSNFCLILDDIRSMANVGSIFRTADCFLASKIYLCGITAQPPHREIEKTALGATDSVLWEHVVDAVELIRQLKSEGWKILPLEQVRDSVSLDKFYPENGQKYAFVLGNEVFGVKQEIIDLANMVVEIPQFGTKHSFNVSVSTGILLWDFYSKINGNERVKPM